MSSTKTASKGSSSSTPGYGGGVYEALKAKVRTEKALGKLLQPTKAAEPAKKTSGGGGGGRSGSVGVSTPPTAAPSAAEENELTALRGEYEQQYNESVAGNNASADTEAARLRQQTEESVRALREQGRGDDLALYRRYREAARTLAGRQAAQGYTGGTSESGRIRLETSYGEGVNANLRARRMEESRLRSAAEQSVYEVYRAAAKANAEALEKKNDRLSALSERQRAERKERAERMAASGDFSGFLELGYSREQVNYLASIWRLQNKRLFR